MSETIESIVLRMKLDAAEVDVGTALMLSKQRTASREYTGFWETALAKKDSVETASSIKSIELERKKAAAVLEIKSRQLERASELEKAELILSWGRYESNLAKKAAADNAYFAARKAKIEEQAAIESIAGGSGAFGSIEAAEAALAGGGKGKGGSHGHGSNSARIRELQVMLRELASGNYKKFFGSVSVFMQTFGNAMKRVMSFLMGPMGIALAAAGVAAYALYEDIKNFNKELVGMEKQNAESIGNSKKAIIDATEAGIKTAASYEAEIRSLANAHETLAHHVMQVVRAINEQAAAQEKLQTAEGNRKLAAINLAQHLGMFNQPVNQDALRQIAVAEHFHQLNPAQAAAARLGLYQSSVVAGGRAASDARAKAEADTFDKTETTKRDALVAEGKALSDAKAEALRLSKVYEIAGRKAQAALTGVDEHGNVVDQAAFARNKQMRERANIEEDIKKRKEKVDAYNNNIDASALIDPLAQQKHDLTLGDKQIMEKEEALLKKREKQNEGNIAAQQAAEQAYKDAVKMVQENAASLKAVNEAIDQYKTKFKDAGTAMSALHSDLVSRALNNESAQIDMRLGMDRVNPTISDLAGRRRMGIIDRAYGRGGRFDLGRGDGPFGAIAGDYELAQKQQMWDIQHGNAIFNDRGQLTGGSAFQDKERASRDRQLLGAAGIQTPEMQISSLIENGAAIQAELVALNKIMAGTPTVAIVDTPEPASPKK